MEKKTKMTPRTDAVEERNGNVLCGSANLEFARTLERELTIELGRATHYRDQWQRVTAELVTERARLDWLDAECSRGVNKLAHGSEERRSHVFTNGRMVKNKLGSGEVFDCDHYYGTDTRAAIDAAMKEGA